MKFRSWEIKNTHKIILGYLKYPIIVGLFFLVLGMSMDQNSGYSNLFKWGGGSLAVGTLISLILVFIAFWIVKIPYTGWLLAIVPDLLALANASVLSRFMLKGEYLFGKIYYDQLLSGEVLIDGIENFYTEVAPIIAIILILVFVESVRKMQPEKKKT